MLTQVPEEPWATVVQTSLDPYQDLSTGTQMLLVMIDRFSKWTELVPLRSATAESLKKTFRERKVRGPEGGHNGQWSTVCKPHI